VFRWSADTDSVAGLYKYFQMRHDWDDKAYMNEWCDLVEKDSCCIYVCVCVYIHSVSRFF
jgi:hypothetical protein